MHRFAAGLLILCLLGAASASDETSGPSTEMAGSSGPDRALDATLPPSLEARSGVTGDAIGEFDGTDVWVDPIHGDDANDGRDRDTRCRRSTPHGV